MGIQKQAGSTSKRLGFWFGILFFLALLFFPHSGGMTLVGFTTALAVFVFWAHRTNVRRLLRGEENRFGRKKGDSAPKPEGES